MGRERPKGQSGYFRFAMYLVKDLECLGTVTFPSASGTVSFFSTRVDKRPHNMFSLDIFLSDDYVFPVNNESIGADKGGTAIVATQ